MAADVTINNALDFAQNTANSSAQLASDFDDFLWFEQALVDFYI